MFQYLFLLETEEEKEFFKLIYEKHRNEMYYTALGILKNQADAEDIVHETFLTLTKHLDKIIDQEPHKVWSYIITTVKHKSYNLHKRKKIQETGGLEEWQAGEIFEKGPEVLTVEAELQETMKGLLRELKTPYREVLELQYYHELSVQEIAEEMGKTPDNIRHISMRAKKKLQSALEERGILG